MKKLDCVPWFSYFSVKNIPLNTELHSLEIPLNPASKWLGVDHKKTGLSTQYFQFSE